MHKHRVTFHLNNGPKIEESFYTEESARARILDVMHGRAIIEAVEDGNVVFIATHQISGAILHPQPVADV